MSAILRYPYEAATSTYRSSQRVVNSIISSLTGKIEDKIAAPILKACVFHEAAFQSKVSKNVFLPIARIVVNTWQRCSGIDKRYAAFDPNRLKRSKDFLNEFGIEKTITTEDGIDITYALYKAEDFQKWIKDNGGEIEVKTKHVLIKAKDDASWEKLQTLRNFRCFEEIDRGFKLPKVIKNAEKKCIFRCQGSGREIPMDKKYIGLHLALGFNYAVFDWRKEASLKNYFKDAEAAIEVLKEDYSLDQVTAMGSCRATFVVSHLKEKYHDQGLNAVLIHPVPDLKSTIDTQKGIVKKVGLMGLNGLQRVDASFDNLERLRNLSNGNAKTFVVVSEGDTTLPANTGNLFKEAIGDNSPCIVWEIPKKEGADAHFSDPLLDNENYINYANNLVGINSIPDSELI